MAKLHSPSWQTTTEGMSEDEVVKLLQDTPTKRLLSSLRGFPRILMEIANSDKVKEPDKGDMKWMADRLRVIVVALEQQWEIETNEKA